MGMPKPLPRRSSVAERSLIVGAVAIAGAALFVVCSTTIWPGKRQAVAAPPDALAQAVGAPTESMPYEDAKPILASLRNGLPTELRGMSPAELGSVWPGWVSHHNTVIRARLERGDEDSIVNFWLYGTTFTTLPRATQQDLTPPGAREKAEELLLGRLDDLVAGIASPGANERLRFARQVLERHGINPTTSAGQDRARIYLVETRARVVAENDRYRRSAQSAKQLNDRHAELGVFATMYRDRGLSSDTRIHADFALDRALEAMRSDGRLGPGSIRRVALVGPGLDFTDKAEGFDFYPQQTIQPFALIDSLVRLEFSSADQLRMTTLDLSPRVNQHLEAARERARDGNPYTLQLPLDSNEPSHQWHPDLVTYWQHIGDRIGDEVQAIRAPSGAEGVPVRAVRVRPGVVLSIIARDVNIVVERLASIADGERFDLIVATNVLVYYDAFDQALALANVSKMLRPGGFFLTNYAVSPTAPMETSASLVTSVDFDRQHNGDTLFWYQRR